MLLCCLLQVAVLDVDVCGPSIPLVMGLEGEQVHNSGSGWSPVVRTYVRMHCLNCTDNVK